MLLVAAALAFLDASSIAMAQTAQEHAAHHPGGDSAVMTTAGDTVLSLMRLPVLPAERRTALAQEAHGRMMAGTAAMAAAVDRLSVATTTMRSHEMLDALDQLRTALAITEAGVATRVALDTASHVRDAGATWLRSEMNLTGAQDTGGWTHGFSLFHVIVMGLLLTFAVAVVSLQIGKMRRIERLLAAARAAHPPPPGAAGGQLP